MMILSLASGRRTFSVKKCCVVIDGDKIIYVAKKYNGKIDKVLNTRNRMISPGFINCHAYVCGSPFDKSYRSDLGDRQFYYSSLPFLLPCKNAALDEEAKKVALNYSILELKRTGATTVIEENSHYYYSPIDSNKENKNNLGEYLTDTIERIGLRAYIGPMYRFGKKQYTPDGKRVDYEWNEEKGKQDFKQAVDAISRINKKANNRIKGILFPAQVDTCTE